MADASAETTEALEKLPLMGVMPREPQVEPGAALKSTNKKVSCRWHRHGWRHVTSSSQLSQQLYIYSSGIGGVFFFFLLSAQ